MRSAIRRLVPRALVPWARRVISARRRRDYDRKIERFVREKSGRADRLPSGAVYEATMRCNLHCEFCWIGDQLNIEGEWKQELSLERLQQAFPASSGFQISITGGEIFMRKDIFEVLALFHEKGYSCGYLTTNGTIIDDARADALAELGRAGFLKHVSVSIDGPKDLHDLARGMKGTFDRTAAGLRRLQQAARRKGVHLPVSINTTVTHEGLEELDRMADVAEELGVDSIGLNHLMFSTPEEVSETLRLLGESDPTLIQTFVTPNPGLSSEEVRRKITGLAEKCRSKGIRFGPRPLISDAVLDNYYRPGAPLKGRCLYPFLNARVGFNGKMYFCPLIRIEVGDLTKTPLEEIWNGERYVALRRRLLENELFPVCGRCCKVELSPEAVTVAETASVPQIIPLQVLRS